MLAISVCVLGLVALDITNQSCPEIDPRTSGAQDIGYPKIRSFLIRVHYSTLSQSEQEQYVNRLEKKGEIDALWVLGNSSQKGSRIAGYALVLHLPTEDAIRYCHSLIVGSPKWACIIQALATHPEPQVSVYLLDVIRKSDHRARCVCYNLCRQNRWKALLKHAQTDLNSKVPVAFVNQPLDELTVGAIAKKYLNKCAPASASTRSVQQP